MHSRSLVAAFALATSLTAQNLVPNGEFHDGATGWTQTQFNDPLGSTGFSAVRVVDGRGPSMAVWADFQTLSPVMSATFVGPVTFLPQAPLPVSFDVMWEKQVTTPIPSVTVNRVELRVRDASNALVFTGTQNAPNQTGLQERASFSGTLNVPAAGNYTFELFLRHSNLAGIPFRTHVDNVVCGAPVVSYFGAGCAGSGGFVPLIGTANNPAINTTNFAIELSDAYSPTAALFVLGTSNTSWPGGPLPFALGGGCSLHVNPASTLVAFAAGSGPGTGAASMTLAIPNNSAFQGWQLFAQYGPFDPAATNPYGLVTTSGLGFVVQ